MAIKKNRQISIEERNSKIENMELDELKKYLCMKNYQNPEKCFGCPGIKNCKAGQRAVVLLDKREKEQMSEQEKQELEKDNGTRASYGGKMRTRFEEVCQQKNMIAFTIEKYEVNRNAAREKLKYWAKKQTDIAEKYGFWEKFSSGCTRPTGSGYSKYTGNRTEEAKQRYYEAAAQDDPIAFVMEKYGLDKKRAAHNFHQWARRYGKVKTAEEEQQMQNDDEISLEDFLKETENEPEPHEEPQPHEEPMSVENAAKEPKTAKKSDARFELDLKFAELDRKKHDAREQIANLERLIADIEKAQDAIAMTLNLLNPESAIAKGLL